MLASARSLLAGLQTCTLGGKLRAIARLPGNSKRREGQRFSVCPKGDEGEKIDGITLCRPTPQGSLQTTTFLLVMTMRCDGKPSCPTLTGLDQNNDRTDRQQKRAWKR